MRRCALLALAVLAIVSCNEIQSRRRSRAPLNASSDFPCEQYADSPAESREGRCLVDTQILYEYTIVIHVPETSLYGPGHTFVLTPGDLTVALGEQTAKVPILGTVTGAYSVSATLSARLLAPDRLVDGQSIPVRATYVPVGRDATSTYEPALPLGVVFAASRVDEGQSPTVSYVRSLPAGRWLRIFEPAPPWDSVFPPHIGTFEVKKRFGEQVDFVDVRDVDDPEGTSRETEVTRAAGLDDWTVWLRDHVTAQRISTLQKLEGTSAKTRLETIGFGTSFEGAPNGVDVVVAPPAGWIGVPMLVSELINGCCLTKIPYPELRAPVALEGIVASNADGGVFLAVASRVTFDSESISLPGGVAQTLLRYSATVSTDDRGRFATVLPPGTYRVTVEPFEGTGFASFRNRVVIDDNERINLSPPRRTRVRGAAVLTDGRPALDAEVLATPEPLTDTSAQPMPRPARTKVGEDGTFALDLDQGAYVITVVPEEGTGFPRVVTRATIPANEADIGVVRIPPPQRLGLTIVDPTTPPRPIPLANVRIFATPQGGGATVYEIGSGMTNGEGKVEILLAQQPK